MGVDQGVDNSGFVGAARRRALLAWCALAAGLVVGRSVGARISEHEVAMVLATAGALCVVAALMGGGHRGGRGRLAGACMLVAVALFGTAWFDVRVRHIPTDSISRHLSELGAGEKKLMTIEGTVVKAPEQVGPAPGVLSRFAQSQPRWLMVVESQTIVGERGAIAVSGRLYCSVTGEIDGAPGIPTLGGRVRVTGFASPTRPSLNPGQPARELVAAQSDIWGSVSTTDSSLVVPIAREERGAALLRGGVLGMREWLRKRAADVLDRATRGSDPQARSLVFGLLLGTREDGYEPVESVFTRLGLIHILSISGFHVTLVGLTGTILLRLSGDRGAIEPVLRIALVLAYLLLVPAEAPILRSGITVAVLLGAEACGRRYDPLTILLWASFGLLVWRPMDLWSLGYELSCGLTALLLWLSPRVQGRLFGAGLIVPGRLREPTVRRWVVEGFKSSVSSSLMCWIVAAPLVWLRIGTIPTLAAAASVVLVPIISPLMIGGALALILGMLVPPVAGASALVIGSLADVCLWVAGLFDAVPFATISMPPISWWSAGIATGVLLYLVGFAKIGRARTWVALAAALVSLAASVVINTTLRPGTLCRLDTLAVGDGTCQVIRSGRDAVLWDCGSLVPGMGVRQLPAAMRALGIWRIHTAVISHGDFDHLSALPEVAAAVGLRELLVEDRLLERAATNPRGPIAACVEALRARGVEVRTVAAGDALAFGRCVLTFLSPTRGNAFTHENDHSLVARVDAAGALGSARAALVLTGDVESSAIEDLGARFPELSAEAMDAPHHGSGKADAAAWTLSLRPWVVVQSTGTRRLELSVWQGVRSKAAWLATPRVGAVWVEVSTDGHARYGGWKGKD